MAYTVSAIAQSVYGNKRMNAYKVTADAASGSVATGVKVIEWAQLSVVSMATAAAVVKINTDATSAALNGTIFISSIANGDVFFLTVYGH